MTDQELNEKIAVKRGYCVFFDTERNRTYLYEKGKSVFICWGEGDVSFHDMWIGANPDELPDYCNSWLWAGELLEDLQKGYRVWQTRKGWICAKINAKWIQSNSPTRAIAEAWDSVNT